uniref:Uncharacterized protein n=1 Tax=Neogobius melanostomus TaxID=47308 RepID=A0A8C6UG04_9GOBI
MSLQLHIYNKQRTLVQVLPPENVRLGWFKDLYEELSWTPPKHSQGCYYKITSTPRDVQRTESARSWSSPWHNAYRIIQGGYLKISIQTVCNSSWSEAVVVGIDDPDFELSCVILSSARTHCSWKPPDSARLSFFYSLQISKDDMDTLRECPSYNSTTGCDLQVKPNRQINVLLNGTLGNRTIRNVYKFDYLKLSLPPLDWAVEESKEQFLITWTAPEFSDLKWNYKINYTACNNTSYPETQERSFKLQRDSECPYRISMRGMTRFSGGTEWTPEKHYDKASGPNPLLFAVVLIPLVLALLVVLTLLGCLKNKDRIFPKVPQPNSELFKDLMTNNNKINLPNFYFPKAEEECPVTLVVDPKQPQL